MTQARPSVLDQYRALTGGVAVVDRSDVGSLRLTGKDAVDLLDRLSTNDLTGLTPGGGVSTVLTTNKGRIIDLLTVVQPGDHLLALCSKPAATRVAEWIDFYTFGEEVMVSDETDQTFIAGLAGPGAAETLHRLAGDAAADLPRYRVVEFDVAGVNTIVVRTDFVGTPGFDLVASAGDGATLKAALEANSEIAGSEALEALRTERGIPAFGSEINEDHNPLEAGLIESVSFNKGCYVGQEVVARLNTYDKVQRRLAVLTWAEGGVSVGDEVAPNTATGNGKAIGSLTSVAEHPSGGFVGLAYVRRAFEGAVVTVGPSGTVATMQATTQ